MTAQSVISLNDGNRMPTLGLNTWNLNFDDVDYVIKEAIQVGYRYIDTSIFNFNEKLIGKALKAILDAGKVKRSELFIVTKLPPTANKVESVQDAILQSLASLQLEYVDLYLIQTPVTLVPNEHFDAIKWNKDGSVCLDDSTNHVQVWKKMEDLVMKGLTKSIGLANFNRNQIDLILPNCSIVPAVLQIEYHIFLQQPDLIEYSKKLNIVVCAFAPLGSQDMLFYQNMTGTPRQLPNLLEVPAVQAIAKKYKKTESQVLIRWILEKNFVVSLRMTNSSHMRDILDTYNFSLEAEDAAQLNGLDRNLRYVDMKFLKGIEHHPEFPF